MLLVDLSADTVGKTLSRTIFGGNGEVLLTSGALLTQQYIDRLAILGITRAYVADPRFEDVEVDEPLSDRTRTDALAVLTGLAGAANPTSQISKRLSAPTIGKLVDSIILEIMSSPLTVAACADLRSYDEYTFHHSVNACVIALQLGRKAGLSGKKLHDLGLGTILHDVGKLHVPVEILNKPGSLDYDEFEVIKSHSALGWEDLRSMGEVGPVARSASLQHHERWDGRGYPKGLAGGEICWISRYVAVADVFDALTSDRPYRKALHNSVVLSDFLDIGNPAYDPEVLAVLHRVACPYPPATMVRLSEGGVAVVVKVHESSPATPVVRLLQEGTTIDLRDAGAPRILAPAS